MSREEKATRMLAMVDHYRASGLTQEQFSREQGIAMFVLCWKLRLSHLMDLAFPFSLSGLLILVQNTRNSFAGMKNFYQCCQIGHLLNQLVKLSVSFRRLLTQKRTIKFLWQCMMAQLLIMDISHEAIHQPPQQRFISQFIE